MLLQISGRTHPHIADDLPMAKACKEVFHPVFSGAQKRAEVLHN